MFETEQRLNWSQSEAACEQRGGYLATLESMEEILWVKRYKAARHTLSSQMYLGGKKIDNFWYWVRGMNLSAFKISIGDNLHPPGM